MEQSKVTDYFRTCKRQSTYSNKLLNSSKVILDNLNIEAVHKSRRDIESVCSLNDNLDVDLRKSAKRKNEKLQLSYKPPISDIEHETEPNNQLELESTPKSRNLDAAVKSTPVALNTSRSYRSSKQRKGKAKDRNLFKTPSTPFLDGNNHSKSISQSVRKRLLLQNDCPEPNIPHKILKYESSEEKETAIGVKVHLENCKNFIKLDDISQTSPFQNHIPKVPEKLTKHTNKDSTKENKLKAIHEKLSKLNRLKANLKERPEKHSEIKESPDLKHNSPKVPEAIRDDRREKLKAVQEKLSKNSSLKTKLKEKRSELKEKYGAETPGYQKYHYLASLPSKTLVLPYKYKSLEEIFHSADRTISLLHNRHEVCTFSKLKHSVQEMTKRNFNKTHLGQIKTVFPSAYEFCLDKDLNVLSTGSSTNECQLTVIPNFDYGDNVKPDGVTPLCNQLQKTEIHKIRLDSIKKPSEKSFVTMNSACLSARRSIFHYKLLEMAKCHHEKFLANLNPPVHIPSDKILRWHPRFPLDDVPNIPVAPFPEPIDKNYPTAKDVLNLIKHKMEAKVENALQNVAEKHKEIMHSKPDSNEVVQKGALKGISQALVEKIRAREALRMKKVMTRQPEVEKRLEMIARFPALISILRNYFITLHRVAISVDDVSKKISDSYQSHLSSESAQQHLYLMADLLPEWMSINIISRGPFIKIDKNKDVKIIIEKINQFIKEES